MATNLEFSFLREQLIDRKNRKKRFSFDANIYLYTVSGLYHLLIIRKREYWNLFFGIATRRVHRAHRKNLKFN
jgi:hypothetical protein